MKFDLSVTRRPDPSKVGSFVPLLSKKKRTSQCMKWSLITIACDLGATEMTPRQREKLFWAVTRTQSYYYGFVKDCISLSYFRKLFVRFKKSLLKDPTRTFELYKNEESSQLYSMNYTVMLLEFSVQLHTLRQLLIL